MVGQKYVDLGDYIAPGQKLLTVVDPSRFKIRFTVPEQYLSRLKTGLPVSVHFDGRNDSSHDASHDASKNAPSNDASTPSSFQGVVYFIDPVVDPDAHTLQVKAMLPASAGLRHGLFGRVTLSLGMIRNAVAVPEEAVVPQGEKTFVYVVCHESVKADGKTGKKAHPGDIAHLREIVVGHRAEGLAQIARGLSPGERVITAGLQKVSDAQEVNLKPPSAAPPSASRL